MKPDTVGGLSARAASATSIKSVRRSPSPIGTNLDEVTPWHPDPPFANLIKCAGGWVGGTWESWNHADPIDVDARQNLRSLRANQIVRAVMLTDHLQHFPGQWVLEWDGDADATLDTGSQREDKGILEARAGLVRVHVPPEAPKPDGTPDRRTMTLIVSRVNPANPPRNWRLRRLKDVVNGESEAIEFDKAFKARLSIYSCLRPLGWMHTNNHGVGGRGNIGGGGFAGRPVPEDVFWTGPRGVPIEATIDLANQTGCDLWLPIPHTWTDDDARAFAALVHERLDPERTLEISHANEIWNGNEKNGFTQAKWCIERGMALGLAASPTEAAARYHARRTVELGRIFTSACFGRRVVVVLDSAHGELHRHAWMKHEIEAFTGKPVAMSVGLLSTAPYVGYRYGDSALRDPSTWAPIDPTWGEKVLAMTPEEIVRRLVREDVPMVLGTLAADIDAARAMGLELKAYESGQHLVPVGHERKKIAKLVTLLIDANRHPRMGKVYTELFGGYRRLGVVQPMHFTHSGAWTEHGSWGSMEGPWIAPRASPKRGALEVIARWPRWWKEVRT